MHRGAKLQTEDGLSLGPGPFVRLLEEATGHTATVMGKPEGDFFKTALAYSPDQVSGF